MRPALVFLGLSTLLTASLIAQGPAAPVLTIGDLQAAARRDSNDASAHYALALGFWEQGRLEEADRSLHEAVAISPGYAEAYLALSQLPYRRGQDYWKGRAEREGMDSVQAAFAEAAGYYRRAFLLNPLVDLGVLGRVNLPTKAYSLKVDGKKITIRPPAYAHDLETAINNLHAGNYEQAAFLLEKIVRDKPFKGNIDSLPDEILFYGGLVAAHRNRFDPAIQDFALLTRRAHDREQDSLRPIAPLLTNDFRFILATLLFLNGQYDNAIPTFRRTLEVDLGLYVAHVQLARMHEARDNLPDALAERRRAVDVNPENSDLLVDLAGTMLLAGQLDSAIVPLRDAARLNPRDPRVPYLQGIIASRLRQPALADSAFTRFLAIAPSRFSAQIAEVKQRTGTP